MLHGKNTVWRDDDYKEFFRRIKSGRIPSDVGRDYDVPSRQAFVRYLKERPDLKKRYDAAWESLPFSVQARAGKSGERYRRTLVRLRKQGKTWKQVARIMRVNSSAVRSMWHTLKKTGQLKKYIRAK